MALISNHAQAMDILLRDNRFQRKLLLSIGGTFLLFAICFMIYQHQREKAYRIDILHARMQMYNQELYQSIGRDHILDTAALNRYLRLNPIEGLRITIVNDSGRVLLDSQEKDVSTMGNHLPRNEVKQALLTGNGYDIKRVSESTQETYFYSATKIGHTSRQENSPRALVIRSAIPYSTQLTQSLRPDNRYLYFSFVLIVLLGTVLYFLSRRISHHISYLREFAIKAEQGKEIDPGIEHQMPDDELADISHTIVTLFGKLKHAEEDKVRLKRQLTQNAAHELKTPAGSIHGYLESILDNSEMPEAQRQHFLERCYTQSERMSKLLHDMSALTRLDEITGNQPFQQYTQVNINTIVQNVADDVELQLQEQGISLRTDLPENISVPGDQGYLYSIFRNLTDNALSYATGATLIRIQASDDGKGFYWFTFSDNGIGVPPQHIPHLFERFYRVDKGRSRKLGGTGLGLAIVKNAVSAHGGTVTAYPTPGGGLTIQFSLRKTT